MLPTQDSSTSVHLTNSTLTNVNVHSLQTHEGLFVTACPAGLRVIIIRRQDYPNLFPSIKLHLHLSSEFMNRRLYLPTPADKRCQTPNRRALWERRSSAVRTVTCLRTWTRANPTAGQIVCGRLCAAQR